MSAIFLIIGLVIFSLACRSFQNRYIQKAGWLALLVATYYGGFALTGSHAWGAFALSLWFIFPWLDIVTRVRKLRFPIQHDVKHRFPPSRDIFPDLEEITREVEDQGFEKADDAGWKWEDMDHFVRLFYHPEKRLQASISVAQQEGLVFSFASITSRTAEGVSYVSTNYPFSFSMKPSPRQRMNRCDDIETFEQMVQAHEAFLQKNQITHTDVPVQDPDLLHTMLATDFTQQVDHNLNAGMIVRLDEEYFRYSWRGCFFLWFQVIKDMIRV